MMPAAKVEVPPLTEKNRLVYCLITPARDEAEFIEATIQSVVRQTHLPLKWVIVSDGSTDGTDDIVLNYARQHPWIELLRMPERRDRQFAAKAHCFNAAYGNLTKLIFDVIGNLDADITFEPDYLGFLVGKFAEDGSLGVVGTPFVEDHDQPDRHTYAHRFAQLEHVSGACQLFRRQCFDEVGGYQPIKGGAVDWIAVTTARMHGWKTRTFTEKVCLHHRKIGTGNSSALMVRYRYGQKAYYVGGHPAWILLRTFTQMRARPRILGGLLFCLGYFWPWLTRRPRLVSPELATFYRAEQAGRMRNLIPGLLRRSNEKNGMQYEGTYDAR